MKPKASAATRTKRIRRGPPLLLALLGVSFSACASGEPELPEPRPIVIRSGERLYAEAERMESVQKWVTAQQNNIQSDPSFLIETTPRESPAYPWESLILVADTAKIGVEQGYDMAGQVYGIYAHYHLMDEMGRIGEFLPGGESLDGFPLERAILSRIADAWFLARAVYQAQAYDPLEEILYSNENGYLEAFILTAREDDFSEERQSWLTEDPQALERYRQWFLETFSREPPGLGH
jgi:hypothetical protein